MKRELGIARCGLACCLFSKNEHCRTGYWEALDNEK